MVAFYNCYGVRKNERDELDAWGWCIEMTQRDGTQREEGGRFKMGNTCIPVADSC